MTDFQQGWWSCFLSFAETNEFYADANDIPCLEVLRGAGVSSEECRAILDSKEMDINENVKRYISYYLNKIEKTCQLD